MNSFYGELKRYKPPPTEDRPQSIPTTLPPTQPSFPWFSPEEKQLWRTIGQNPNAGWDTQGIPAFTTSYLHLEKMTGEFPDNGQPKEVNRRRIWSTLLIQCDHCDGLVAAHWVDRWALIAGYYCDACHKDYPISSYLERELRRKPSDSVVSGYTGYLSDNPDFQAFSLWEPGKITYLGAAMGQGKTTEIFRALATEKLGQAGIVLVPRISLAQALAAHFRYEHGYDAWGLFHEGSGNDNRFIGKYGAIGCLSSLSRMMHQASEQNINRICIAVDESDFSYQLKLLQPRQAKSIMNTLIDVCKKEGLLVAGQTESLLSLEALALEIEIERDDIRSFYSRNATAIGKVSLVQYPNRQGNTQALRLKGAIESIKCHLSQNRHVYAFFSDRRDVKTLATVFAEHQPVIYTAYTKGEKRSKAFLRNQKLTDSPLFLATSAACVGINIIAPDAVTVIVTGKRFGQRPWKEVIQESLRNRARTDVEIHYTDNAAALPVKPSEAEATSLFHEAMKDYETNHPGVSEHASRDYAFSTLADAQPEIYITYHLQEIAGMKVEKVQGNDYDADTLQDLKGQARAAKENEDAAVKERARIYLNRGEIWTDAEIRRRSINAGIDDIAHLAHEKLNKYCQAVGWDGESEIELTDEQRKLVLKLIDAGVDTKALIKRRRGWIATRFSDFYEQIYGKEKANAYDTDLESSAITDDRFRGEVLRGLLNGLEGRTFTSDELGRQVIDILTAPRGKGNDTLLSLILKGALGTATYRQTRFIGKATPAATVEWVRQFIPEWYPVRIKKEYGKDCYALTADDTADTSLFKVWAKYRYATTLDTIEGTDHVELPSEQIKRQAIEMRKQGKTRREIEEETGLSRSAVERATKTLRSSSTRERIIKVLADGHPHTSQEITTKGGIAFRNFNLEVKKMENVELVKRGIYQLVSN